MSSREIKPEMFKGITFRRKDIPGLSIRKYRIYTDAGNYTLVEAENAQGALEASGIKNPLRVLHDSIYLDNIIKVEDPAPAEKAQEVQSENVPAAPAVTPGNTPQAALDITSDAPQESVASPAAANAALTSEDVDKLLSN